MKMLKQKEKRLEKAMIKAMAKKNAQKSEEDIETIKEKIRQKILLSRLNKEKNKPFAREVVVHPLLVEKKKENGEPASSCGHQAAVRVLYQ